MAFMVQILAAGLCQMGDAQSANAASMTGHPAHQAMPLMSGCAAGIGMQDATSDSSPRPEPVVPCSHCNQPDELLAGMQSLNFAADSVSLFSLAVRVSDTDNTMPVHAALSFEGLIPPPGSRSFIYRTSQRIRI